jgi:peptidoglycan-associated lipoprotein
MNKKTSLPKTLCVLSLAAIMLAAVGCAKKKQDVPITTAYVDPDADSRAGGTAGTGQPEIDPSQLLWTESGLQKVYFDFDSSALRPDAISTLQRNADLIKQAPGAVIRVEGHCDERGTQEYNMALGERRALSVRDYLIRLGVPANRLITISYGEEMPAAMGSNEAAWAQNRRVEFSRGQ